MWGVWGVWGERGEKFLHHPPTPPTPPTLSLPIAYNPNSAANIYKLRKP
nr:hypothetical protein [Nostoc sp. ChiSLP01]